MPHLSDTMQSLSTRRFHAHVEQLYARTGMDPALLRAIDRHAILDVHETMLGELVMTLYMRMVGSEPETFEVSQLVVDETRRNAVLVFVQRDLEAAWLPWLRRLGGKVGKRVSRHQQTTSREISTKLCPHIDIPDNRPHLEFMEYVGPRFGKA